MAAQPASSLRNCATLADFARQICARVSRCARPLPKRFSRRALERRELAHGRCAAREADI